MATTVNRQTGDTDAQRSGSHRFRSRPPGGIYSRAWRPAFTDQHPGVVLAEAARRNDPANDGRLPWVTFVLGSGCLSDETAHLVGEKEDQHGEGENDLHARLAALVEDAFAGVTLGELTELDAAALRVLTADFIAELARSRVPGRVQTWLTQFEDAAESSADAVASRRFAVLAAAGAALAARLYLDTTQITRTTLPSPQREVVRFDVDAHPRLRAVDAQVRKPLQQIVKVIDRPAAQSGDNHGRSAYLAVVRKVAEETTFTRERIELLGAFAWHFLTDKTGVYPGWSDVLLFQAAELKDSHTRFLDDPMLRRPYLDSLSGLTSSKGESAWLARRMLNVTTRAWEAYDDEKRTGSNPFYRGVADLLIQQAEASNRLPAAPLATAFVSGFDVELEMALLRRLRAQGGAGTFAVVVPVFHVRGENDNDGYNATLHWVWKEVSAAAEDPLAELLTGGRWRLADDPVRPGSLYPNLRGLPVVVHLSGAPLIDVSEALRGQPDWVTHHEARPALLLDENTSLIQVALDLKRYDGRLPDELVSDREQGDAVLACIPRYWVFVGVQLTDPAVRLRLLSREISAAWLTNDRPVGQVDVSLSGGSETVPADHTDGTRHPPKQGDPTTIVPADRGLVVNSWSPIAERQLFQWRGFGIVTATAGDLVPDLEHLHRYISVEILKDER